MAAQASAQLGEDGRRLNRSPTQFRFWFVAADQIISTKLDFGPPARLLNLTMYQVSNDGHLIRTATAEAATSEAASTEWRLVDGSEWLSGVAKPQTDRIERLGISLNPLWLTYLGISPMYLPQPVLEALAGANDQSYYRGEYRMWIYLRYLDLLLPACMMLLASSLALALLANGITFERVLILAVTGYFMHVLMRACVLLGGHGELPPFVAAFLAPTIAAVLIVVVLLLTHLRGIGWEITPRMLFQGFGGGLFSRR